MRAAAAGLPSIHQCPQPSSGATRAPVLSARRAILAGVPWVSFAADSHRIYPDAARGEHAEPSQNLG